MTTAFLYIPAMIYDYISTSLYLQFSLNSFVQKCCFMSILFFNLKMIAVFSYKSCYDFVTLEE
jgi:hypothetical protein